MKTVFVPVQVPDWVTHRAQDERGGWYGYAMEPKYKQMQNGNGFWFTQVGMQAVFLCQTEPNPNWRETLREVE